MELAHDRATACARLWDGTNEVDEERGGLGARTQSFTPRRVLRCQGDGIPRKRQDRSMLARTCCKRAHRQRRVALELFAVCDRHVPVEEENSVPQLDGSRRLAAWTFRPQAIEEA